MWIARPALASLALCLAAACAGRPAPNVLVIVVDTLRADRVGWLTGDRELTPFLDTLAARGFVLPNAYSPSSWTDPAVASLWTSRYPSQHGVTSMLHVLADTERTLAEILRKHGWATGGFSANSILSTKLGYHQGFDRWEFFPPGAEPAPAKERAERVNAEALAWLDTLRRDRPMFLYLQYMEPHFPYGAPESFVAAAVARRADAARVRATLAEMPLARWNHPDPEALAAIESLYDAEVMALDARLRELFAALEARGFLANAIVVVTSDHGEEFMEHGDYGHGTTLYQEVIRVPLLVLLPGQDRRVDVDEIISLVDVTPTLLDLVGILRPASFEGRSLASRLRRPPLLRRAAAALEWLAGHRGPTLKAAYSELVSDSLGRPVAHRHATVMGTRKLIARSDGTVEGYDLGADPRERAPGGLPAGTMAQLQDATRDLARRATRNPSPYYAVTLDESTKARLRALGYVE